MPISPHDEKRQGRQNRYPVVLCFGFACRTGLGGRRHSCLLLGMCLLCFTLELFAQAIDPSYQEIKRPGQGVRNLGMGNIGVALNADENALFYNPAGLAGVDAVIIGLPIIFGVSQDLVDIVDQAQQVKGSITVADLLKLSLGKTLSVRTMFNLSLIFPIMKGKFTLGGLYGFESQIGVHTRNPVAPELRFSFRLDQVQRYGFAFAPGDGHWVFGFQYNIVDRCDQPTSLLTIADIFDLDIELRSFIECYDDVSEVIKLSRGTSYSVGLIRRFEIPLRPTIGITVHNANDMKFTRPTSQSKYPRDEKSEIDFGVAFQPRLGAIRLLMAADIRDIGYQHVNEEFCRKKPQRCGWKRTHLGLELGFWPIDSVTSAFAIRSGYNQGYFTYGAEINPFIFFRWFNIQYAFYTAETGVLPGDRPEKRHIFQLQLSF